jgi:transposase
MTETTAAPRESIGFKRRQRKRVEIQAFLKGKPLGIGIDLAQKKHAVWLADAALVPIKRFMVPHSREGMDLLLERAEEHRRQGTFDRLIVFMEPTAHFWINWANELEARHVDYRLVSSLAVHRQREIEHLTYAKGDYRDAELILLLGMKGQWLRRKLERDPLWLELGALAREHETLLDAEIAEQNRIGSFLELVLPEFFECFKKLGKTARALFHCLAHPSQEAPRTFVALRERLSKIEGHRINKSKLKALIARLESAPCFGVERCLFPTLARMALVLERAEFLAGQRRELRKHLLALYERTPYHAYLSTIPGVTPENHALLLGFVGDPKQYDRASCLVKLAGTEPRENESGQQEGSHSISHRGRGPLRHVLYRIVLGLKLGNDELSAHARRLMTRDQNKLTWTEAAVATGNKYLHIFYRICVDETAYDPSLINRT